MNLKICFNHSNSYNHNTSHKIPPELFTCRIRNNNLYKNIQKLLIMSIYEKFNGREDLPKGKSLRISLKSGNPSKHAGRISPWRTNRLR